jgi:FtsP/CotA-like multicopper oxidase with cupredoxin domain
MAPPHGAGRGPFRQGLRRRAARAACLCGLLLAAPIAHATAIPGRPLPPDPCPRPAPGADVPEPPDLRSRDGVLDLDLAVRHVRAADGTDRYCYVMPDGTQSPTLRLHPGDLLILRLKDELDEVGGYRAPSTAAVAASNPAMCRAKRPAAAPSAPDPCAGGAMTATSTNLHFHGLTVPPLCHQDDVLRTVIEPGSPPFEYRFRIPADEPPGLYWYHPHIHGFSSKQVQGGASGALIVEGIQDAEPQLAGLPERVLVIRDQDLLHPDAPPSRSEPVVPRMLIDRDGDAANNGTGFGKPARDLSVNFVTVPYPDYPTASLRMRPGQLQLWRVLNASAVTYLNLAVVFGRAPQRLGVVAIDGVPINAAGSPGPAVTWTDHIGVPPGGRAEFLVDGPPAGQSGLLVTRTVDTGQGGENDPNRALVAILGDPDAPLPRSVLPATVRPLAPPVRPWLGDVQPARVRRLYFSEKLEDPANPNSATAFFLTLDGKVPAVFDPTARVPDIVVKQGEVEDWIIENRSTELHAFHIHQLHFQLVDWMGKPVHEPFLRDTANVPYFNGRALSYPSVRLRMDFRDPDTVGTFVYHCHLLEHEDGGMMGMIRVEPGDAPHPPILPRGAGARSVSSATR